MSLFIKNEDQKCILSKVRDSEVHCILLCPSPEYEDCAFDPSRRLNVSEFLLEQEVEQQALGRKKTKEEIRDGLRISVYERKLQSCAHKHFWSWHPDRQLCQFWRGLDDKAKDAITSMETAAEKDEMYKRIRVHKGRICFSVLDPLQTARDKHFLEDRECAPRTASGCSRRPADSQI